MSRRDGSLIDFQLRHGHLGSLLLRAIRFQCAHADELRPHRIEIAGVGLAVEVVGGTHDLLGGAGMALEQRGDLPFEGVELTGALDSLARSVGGLVDPLLDGLGLQMQLGGDLGDFSRQRHQNRLPALRPTVLAGPGFLDVLGPLASDVESVVQAIRGFGHHTGPTISGSVGWQPQARIAKQHELHPLKQNARRISVGVGFQRSQMFGLEIESHGRSPTVA